MDYEPMFWPEASLNADILSFWRHQLIPLVSKWLNATFLQICSDEEQTNLHLGWPEG